MRNLILLFILSLPTWAQNSPRFAPVAISVKTSSYAIPANRWAKVYVECENGGTFTVDGATAVDTDDLQAFGAWHITNGTSAYTVPAGYRAEGHLGGSVGALYAGSNSIPVTPATGTLSNFSIGPGHVAGYTNTSGSKNYYGVAIPGNATNRNTTLELPGGTVINGTGTWRATVQEFLK